MKKKDAEREADEKRLLEKEQNEKGLFTLSKQNSNLLDLIILAAVLSLVTA